MFILGVTITGNVLSGDDFTGVFIAPPKNAPFADLSGQSFTLTFQYDDTKAPTTVRCCIAGAPDGSSITGTGSSSPGTAVLQIGNAAYPFGVLPNNFVQSDASRVLTSGSEVRFDVIEDYNTGDTDGNASVEAAILPAPDSPPLTTDYEWQASFSRSGQLSNIPIPFNITRRMGTNPPVLAQRAFGWLIPQTITVTDINSCTATSDNSSGTPVTALAFVDCAQKLFELSEAYFTFRDRLNDILAIIARGGTPDAGHIKALEGAGNAMNNALELVEKHCADEAAAAGLIAAVKAAEATAEAALEPYLAAICLF